MTSNVSNRLAEITSTHQIPLCSDDLHRWLHRWGVPGHDQLSYDHFVQMELDEHTTNCITSALGLAPSGLACPKASLLDLERFPRAKTKAGRQRLSRLLVTLSKWRASQGATLGYDADLAAFCAALLEILNHDKAAFRTAVTIYTRLCLWDYYEDPSGGSDMLDQEARLVWAHVKRLAPRVCREFVACHLQTQVLDITKRWLRTVLMSGFNSEHQNLVEFAVFIDVVLRNGWGYGVEHRRWQLRDTAAFIIVAHATKGEKLRPSGGTVAMVTSLQQQVKVNKSLLNFLCASHGEGNYFVASAAFWMPAGAAGGAVAAIEFSHLWCSTGQLLQCGLATGQIGWGLVGGCVGMAASAAGGVMWARHALACAATEVTAICDEAAPEAAPEPAPEAEPESSWSSSVCSMVSFLQGFCPEPFSHQKCCVGSRNTGVRRRRPP